LKSLPLQNISNIGNKITLFCREKDGSQKIIEDNNFLPYYFTKTTDKKSDNVSIFGDPLKKIYCQKPGDIRKQRTSNSFESDINYYKRYIIDKIDKIDKSPTKILFLDIEVQCTELPRPKETQSAKDPISCITIADNYEKKLKTFYLLDYKSEFEMLDDFCKTVKALKVDCISSWNIDFDFFYMFYRIPNFCKKISPIGQTHWRSGSEKPAGISIVDMLGLYYKFTLGKKASYKLDNIAHDECGFKLWGEETDFQNDLEITKEKNIEDVKKLLALEEKLNLFDQFDSIRRFSKTTWEDQPAEFRGYQMQSNNSKPWDQLYLQVAKILDVILPCKPSYSDEERHEFKTNVKYKKDGAYRETFQRGVFHNKIKLDLGSAYPKMCIGFNLDISTYLSHQEMPNYFPSENEIEFDINKGYDFWSKTQWGKYLVENKIIPVPVTYRESIEKLKKHKDYSNTFPEDLQSLRGIYYFKQNKKAVLPLAYEMPMKWKQELKDQLKSCSIDDKNYKIIENSYKACKGFGNSGFGSGGNMYTRLFKLEVFNAITFLVRDLLHFIEKKLKKLGIDNIFTDTDSFVLNTENKDILKKLNCWISEWAIEKYGNFNVDIAFELEGIFLRLYVGAKCRMMGDLLKPNGEIEEEKKGLQLVRKDSCTWVKDFQKELLNNILDDNSKENILVWIKEKIDDMKNVDIFNIAITSKFNKPRKEYKTSQPYFEALDETQKIYSDFDKKVGDRISWFYMKEPRVLAFDKKYFKHIKSENINWKKMLEVNIFNLLVPIFSGLEWQTELLDLAESYGIILNSQYRNKLLQELDNFDELKFYYSAKVVKKRMNPVIKSKKKVKKNKHIGSDFNDFLKDESNNNLSIELEKRGLL